MEEMYFKNVNTGKIITEIEYDELINRELDDAGNDADTDFIEVDEDGNDYYAIEHEIDIINEEEEEI